MQFFWEIFGSSFSWFDFWVMVASLTCAYAIVRWKPQKRGPPDRAAGPADFEHWPESINKIPHLTPLFAALVLLIGVAVIGGLFWFFLR